MQTQVYPRESKLIVLEPGSLNTKVGYVDQINNTVQSLPTKVGARARPKTEQTSVNQDSVSLAPEKTASPVPEGAVDDDEPTPMDTGDDAASERTVDEVPESDEPDTIYYAGSALDAELAEPHDSTDWKGIIHPIKNGLVEDWDALSGLWQQVITRELPHKINRSRNEWSLMLAVPMSWGKQDVMRATQIVFEDLNMLCLSVIEQPLAALHGCNVQTGVVIDIGHETTDITPIIDSIIIRHAHKTIPLGGKDIDRHLMSLLREDEQFMRELGDTELTEEVARLIKEAGICDVQGDGNDRATVEIQGKTVSVPNTRHQCADILFDPTSFGFASLSVTEAMYLAVAEAGDPPARLTLWDGLLLTGGVSQLRGMRKRLETGLATQIAASETSNEFQAKEVKWVGLPDYFTGFKGRDQDATFVGASIICKIVFLGSSFSYINKSDYNHDGPASIYLKP
ncbi:actin family [Phlyctochytrium arcticum]|nr:actin family [Phlyctochytrium arcticum]